MRKIYLLILSALLLVNCGDEDPLTPTPVKNWYIITPTENMDEVDTKIYEIYKKHNIAVFYKDTIGSEDRGFTDTLGNPILYHKVIDLNYNMRNPNLRTYWEHVDVSTLESKNKLLPMLELIDEKLLPMIDGADVYVPAIYLAQNITQQQAGHIEETYSIRRTFDIFGVSMDGYQQLGDQEFCMEFLKESSSGALEKYSDQFYQYVYTAMQERGVSSTLDPWGQGYADVDPRMKPLFMQGSTYMNIEYYQNQIDRLTQELENENLTDEQILEKQKQIEDSIIEKEKWEGNLLSDEEYNFYFREYGYCNYGFLRFAILQMPTREQDLSMYMELLFFSDESEVREKYADFQIVIDRYLTVKKIFEEAGFDIEKVGNILSH